MSSPLERKYFDIGWELVNLQDKYSHEIFNSVFGKELHRIVMATIDANNEFTEEEKQYENWANDEAIKADLTPINSKGR